MVHAGPYARYELLTLQYRCSSQKEWIGCGVYLCRRRCNQFERTRQLVSELAIPQTGPADLESGCTATVRPVANLRQREGGSPRRIGSCKSSNYLQMK
jgi:hypothetical protein